MPRDRWSRITRQRVQSHRIHRGNHRSHAHGSKGRYGRDLHVYAPGVRKGAKPRHAPKKVRHRTHNAKANAKHYGKPYGRAAANRPPHRRAAPAGASRIRPAPTTGVIPRRGANEALINPKVRPLSGVSKSNAAKAKAAKAKAAKANASRAKPNKANAHKAQPNRSKGAGQFHPRFDELIVRRQRARLFLSRVDGLSAANHVSATRHQIIEEGAAAMTVPSNLIEGVFGLAAFPLSHKCLWKPV
jgi:hypothetical protein